MRRSLKLAGLVAAGAVGLALGSSAVMARGAAAALDAPMVEWGGTTHATRESLEAWLTVRGLGYEAWAYQHPIAALRLDQEAERAQRANAAPSPSSSATPTPVRRVGAPLLLFVGALGLALATVAVVLSAANVRFRPSLRFASDRRAYVALAGAACLAVAAASYAVQI